MAIYPQFVEKNARDAHFEDADAIGGAGDNEIILADGNKKKSFFFAAGVNKLRFSAYIIIE